MAQRPRPQKNQPVKTALSMAFAEIRRSFIAIGVFSFFINLLMLVTPLYMFQVFDRVLASGRTETLIMLTVIAGFALLVFGALEAIRNRLVSRISLWLEKRISGDLISTSVRAQLMGSASGAQPLRDLNAVRSFVGSPSIFPLFDAPWVPVFVAVIWLLHPWLGVVALAGAVVLFSLALINELSTRALLTEANQLLVPAMNQTEAATRNADVVQAMGMMPGLLQRWNEQSETVLDRQQRAGDKAGLILGFSKFFRMFVQVGILGLGAFLVIRGELTAGGMIAGSILLGRALAPVEQAIGAWKNLIGARNAYDRLRNLMQAIPELPPTTKLPPPKGQLTVDRATFVPPGSTRPVLKQVSFEIKPGDVLGLIGPSAAGKSTLCRLIVGTWPPTSGHVRLDAADVYSWDRVDLGRYIGYLPQDVELFSGTVKENIARMMAASDEMVIEAAQLAGVHDLILHLPDGYQTQIGDKGAVLSGGQRQRIGLARALFGRPKLLVLDEPNSNLDQDGEAALMNAIVSMKQRGSTVIMVAHRPSIMMHVDKVLVMRDGAVEMFGERDQVLPKVLGPRPAQGGQQGGGSGQQLRPVAAQGGAPAGAQSGTQSGTQVMAGTQQSQPRRVAAGGGGGTGQGPQAAQPGGQGQAGPSPQSPAAPAATPASGSSPAKPSTAD